MNAAVYFRIVAVDDHVVHLEHKGFWSDKVVEQIEDTILAQFKQTIDKVSRKGPFIVLADLRELAVLSKKGRVVLSRFMSYGKKRGLFKAVEVVPNAITRLSIREAAELSGKDDFRVMTNSMDEALPIVEKLKEKMLAGARPSAT